MVAIFIFAGALLLFYAIFYSVLALLFAICMKVLMLTLTNEYPKWQLQESIIGTNPGESYFTHFRLTDCSNLNSIAVAPPRTWSLKLLKIMVLITQYDQVST